MGSHVLINTLKIISKVYFFLYIASDVEVIVWKNQGDAYFLQKVIDISLAKKKFCSTVSANFFFTTLCASYKSRANMRVNEPAC